MPLFDFLERLLARAVEMQARRLGPASLLDPWRGLHLGAEDVRAVLGGAGRTSLREPGCVGLIAAAAREVPRLARMAEWLELDELDLAIVALALAPEVDLAYERIYAYLQDDVSRKRPSPDLVASLLAGDAEERLAVIARFGSDAPLVRNGVIELREAGSCPFIGRPIALDAAWGGFLLAREELDPLLARFARLAAPARRGIDDANLAPPIVEGVKRMARAAVAGRGTLRLALTGPHGAGKFALASGLAHDLRLRLLVTDVRDVAGPAEVREVVRRARIAGGLLGALPYFHGVGRLGDRDPQSLRALVEALGASRSWFIAALSAPLPQMHAASMRALQLPLSMPSQELRLGAWTAALERHGIEADAAEVDQVATRFRLSAAQIEQAVTGTRLVLDGVQPRRATAAQLSSEARALCGEQLALLAQRVTPEATFDSLIATLEAEAQLREICARVATRERVRREWTRGCLHARGLGVTALFAGPSGTGKTLAAEVIAGELGYDLFRIDLSAVVSKYIGETEKNLDRVFAAAEHANAVLFFDEADALFGKRSEVKDAHDRYANIEIAYLLQKMEQFDGLAILATNLKQNLDEAFARRLTFSVNFAFPEASERRRLWEALWPPRAPRGADVDLDWFAHEYPLSGGNIRNTVLAAVHLAAADGQVVSREHLLHATRREYQKLGKNIPHPGPVAQRLAS